jgi:hypothetical protein
MRWRGRLKWRCILHPRPPRLWGRRFPVLLLCLTRLDLSDQRVHCYYGTGFPVIAAFDLRHLNPGWLH